MNATFPIGTEMTTINVPVIMDNVIEKVEAFKLNFVILTSLSGKVVPGTITSATGFIIDETGKIEFQ